MKKVVMLDGLTAEKKIDRRIILEANSLGKNGYKVAIVTFPTDVEKEVILHPNVKIVKFIETDEISTNKNNLFWRLYYRYKNHPLCSNIIARRIRMWISAHFIDQIEFNNHFLLELSLKEEGDIYHAHDLPTLPTASKAAEKRKALLIYDSHELFTEQDYLSPSGRRKWAKIEREYIYKANVVITINESIANEIKARYGITKVEVIMNCDATDGIIPSKGDKLRSELHITQDKKILLFQGGVANNRNLINLVKSFHLLKNKYIVLVFLGSGGLIPKLNKIVDKYNLHQRVFFISSVPQKDLLSYTTSADAGIIPYTSTCLNNYYCTPNKLFEFISAGIPILANDLPEIRKIVMENEIGMVADFNSIEGIAKGIDDFFRDTNQLNGYRKNLEKVKNIYSWEQEEMELLRIYNNLLKSYDVPPPSHQF